MVAAPAVEENHALGHAGYTFWVFALPLLLSALIEAPLAFCSDRIGRRRVLRTGMFVLGAALMLASLAHRPWLLSLALALAGAASGAACAAAQGELIASSALGSARAMSRWSAFAALGDALVPFFVAAFAWFGAGYRAALRVLAALVWLQALVSTRSAHEPEDAQDDADGEHPSLASAARMLRQRPRLFLFLLASSLCCLLDEVVVALAALRFRQDLSQGLAVTAIGSTLIALGSLAGALLTDHALTRTSSRRILLISAVVCLGALAWLAQTTSLPASLALLTLVGLCAAPHHALMQAAAYEELPRSPGLVNAALQPFVVIEIAGPIAVGMTAAEAGLPSALLLLAVQPLVIALVASTTLSVRPLR